MIDFTIESAFLPRVFDQPPIKEPEKQLLPVTEDNSSPIDMSSLHLDQTQVVCEL